jgi:starch phosphorylase
MPEFRGRLIVLENYDLALARLLVSGVDVWLNTPCYPMEASGTSGQKAGINGVLNVSLLDGWWAEGYNFRNGWAITPHGQQCPEAFRDQEESGELLDILENEVVPTYFRRERCGYSSEWIVMAKSAMKSILPRFNAQRMVMDYVQNFYAAASSHGRLLTELGAYHARVMADWKRRVNDRWSGVSMTRLDLVRTDLDPSSRLVVDIALQLNGLYPEDVVVDILFKRLRPTEPAVKNHVQSFHFMRFLEDGRALFRIDIVPPASGAMNYRVRAYPWHRLLAHRFEMGRMLWL